MEAKLAELVRRLKAAGCDWIDTSSGGISPAQKIPLGPGYQVPLSRAIRRATSIPTMAVGLITDAKQAERIVASGDADLVAMARAMLWNPRWPWHAAALLKAQVQAPQQYWRSAPRNCFVEACFPHFSDRPRSGSSLGCRGASQERGCGCEEARVRERLLEAGDARKIRREDPRFVACHEDEGDAAGDQLAGRDEIRSAA